MQRQPPPHPLNLSSQLFSESAEQQLKGTVYIRKVLTQPTTSVSANNKRLELITLGLVPRLVHILKERSSLPLLQHEAAWSLTNFAGNEAIETASIIDAGVIPVCIQLLPLPDLDSDVRDQILWMIYYIAQDGNESRELLLDSGVLKPLVRILNDNANPVTLFKNAAFILENLCTDPCPSLDSALFTSHVLPTLTNLLHYSDTEVVQSACFAFSHLISGADLEANDRIQNVIESGAVHKLVQLVGSSDSTNVVMPALTAVGFLLSGFTEQAQVVIDCGVIPILALLLVDANAAIQKDACWALANVATGSLDQIQQMMDADIILEMLVLLQSSADFSTRKEGVHVISNACVSGSHDMVQEIVLDGAITPLCDFLSVAAAEGDEETVEVILDALLKILKVGGDAADADAADADDAGKVGRNCCVLDVEACGGFYDVESIASSLFEHENFTVHGKAMAILSVHDSDFSITTNDADGCADDESVGTGAAVVSEEGETNSSDAVIKNSKQVTIHDDVDWLDGIAAVADCDDLDQGDESRSEHDEGSPARCILQLSGVGDAGTGVSQSLCF